MGLKSGHTWVVISVVISTVTLLIAHIRGLITPLTTTQRAQYPVIKEYSLNHTMEPFIIQALFLNSEVLVSLGTP